MILPVFAAQDVPGDGSTASDLARIGARYSGLKSYHFIGELTVGWSAAGMTQVTRNSTVVLAGIPPDKLRVQMGLAKKNRQKAVQNIDLVITPP